MKNYIALANRTAAGTCHAIHPDLLHCAMGMVTEADEIIYSVTPSHAIEEIGDCMWYVALGCHHLEITLDEALEARARSGQSTSQLAAQFMDQVKRQVFYGKAPERHKLVGLLGDVIQDLLGCCSDLSVGMDEVLEQNIAKLQKRFPGKFTEERAINR